MITVIYDRGGGGENVNMGLMFTLRTGKLRGFYNINYNYKAPFVLLPGSNGTPAAGTLCFIYNDGIVFRSLVAYQSTGLKEFVETRIDGNFNFDMLKIETDAQFSRRVEVRNENGVLITDNGLPWGDGTYPPDAKNRAGLAGLHAAPAVIKPELETALMGDETNKERVQE